MLSRTRNLGKDLWVSGELLLLSISIFFIVSHRTFLPTGEFYFTPNDTTVQFRIGSLSGGPSIRLSGSLSNIDRAEAVRKEMRLTKVPVLRNRRRSFFFVEADGLDTFGPGSASLGPPAEMKTGELEGRQEEDARLRIEPLQQFPFR